MEIVKLNEYYSIFSTQNGWEYRGHIDYMPNQSIRVDITINDSEGTLYGSAFYSLNSKNLSTTTYDRIPQDKEKKFTDYINNIIQDILKTFGLK